MSDQAPENVGQRKSGDGCETASDPTSAPPSQSPVTEETTDTDSAAAAAWRPNAELLQQIVDLGFDKVLAEKALFYTGGESVERAANWIIDYGQHFDDGKPLDITKLSLGPADSSQANMVPHKMVFVVNSALKMGIGKIAAQVGHATLGLYRDMLERSGQEAALLQWADQGETKVVLKADGGEEELIQLMNAAKRNALHTYLVADAGRTQVASGSITVLSIFGASDRMDEVTGQLTLLQ